MARTGSAWFLLALACATPAGISAQNPPVLVHTGPELRAAVASAVPGTHIELGAGIYEGGFLFANLQGSATRPIVISAADAKHAPVFRGGESGMQLSDPAYVELCDLVFEGQTGNGINIDDGGSFATPAHDVVLRRLTVRDIGPDGNRDGIKLSGLDDFRVEDCVVERWGRGGSAIDMVGCRRGTIEGCVFRHTPETNGASGVQLKGGTRDVAVLRNRFENAGGRAINIGGSTGLEYFRPALAEWVGARFEAKDIRVEGNTILGSDAPVAFVGVDGARFRFNTLYLPGRWALRILQETREKDFVPSRGGQFSDNLIVFHSERWSSGGANVGADTEAQSFRFERNAWFCVDAPSRTRELVQLPTKEIDGLYGVDPMFANSSAGDLRPAPGTPAAKFGAVAWKQTAAGQ
ncbi:MAG TPA: right-handed parallel beta-helix repeat-containing protein [Planctomycetota bacterium]|nr:right-handed parallel beta-helix repeat-containing protein [Planctomycetota bacterium]